ncbi:hypothetical protein ASZ90_014064 [hydrocarbon metagenome]|uniref:Uncharacterized protein n=1 Tax=hydrocarbon metagenome TaxID=938273 RepID=A0A0W8F5Z2_9ZZZZ
MRDGRWAAEQGQPTVSKDRQATFAIISARNLSVRYISITA